MKKVWRIFFCLLLILFSFSQEPCNDEIIMAIKGKWIKRGDANMKAGNQAQVISRIDKMQKLLQAAYPDPKGIEAAWYRSMAVTIRPLIVMQPLMCWMHYSKHTIAIPM